MELKQLYNLAARRARAFTGSEETYRAFMQAAIGYESAGGERQSVNDLLSTAERAFFDNQSDQSVPAFLEKLQKGGAKVFHHGAVFVPPDQTEQQGMIPGEGDFTPALEVPRLQNVVRVLQSKGIFFDDLVLDVGTVGKSQMRRAPYIIITIPRLNVQIAVANQENEALFIANPAIDFMNWALFEKPMAGIAGGLFENVARVTHASDWENRLLDVVFGTYETPGPKVNLAGYTKAHRKSKYPLTHAMVAKMARMWRDEHPEKKYPTQHSGVIPHHIVVAITGDKNWQEETWKAFDNAGRLKYRGLSGSLSQILEEQGCHYNLTDAMIAKMARMYRDEHPEKQYPTQHSGVIPHHIVVEVTGDKNWQEETWKAFDASGQRGSRGLSGSLSQILEEQGCHYHLTNEMVAKMAQMCRDEHPKKQYPSMHSGVIPHHIVVAVTGDKNWQKETWMAFDQAGRRGSRGLSGSLSQILDEHDPDRRKKPAAGGSAPSSGDGGFGAGLPVPVIP